MSASRTARERARAELTAEIKHTARGQLAEVGPEGLSLRAVARDLGMVSSALYRYFPNRDALLTALIMDAYDALGEAAEQAVAGHDQPAEQWRAGCHAVRGWARANPREYALIYGSPVPGYQAPEDTIAAASRVALTLLEAVRAGYAAGEIAHTDVTPGSPAGLAGQLSALAERTAPELPGDLLVRTLIAWTQLFGMLSFELFGHLVGSVDPSDEFFDHAVWQMARFVGFEVGNPDREIGVAR